jgi:hypothetical protein
VKRRVSLGSFAYGAAMSFVAGGVIALVLGGCSSLTEAKYASNALAASLDAAAPVLRSECIEPYSGANALPPNDAAAMLLAYDRSPCPRALRAYETARKAHQAYYTTILAIEAGDCVNVSRSVTKCDLIGRTNDAVQAGAALVSVMQALVDE